MTNKRSVYTFLVVLFLIAPLQYSIAADVKTRDLEIIAKVEAKLVLPPGSQKLQDYTRYYQIFGRDPHSKIRGLYVTGEPPAGIRIVEKGKMPGVLDGGCGVINVVFTRSGKIISIQCNGLA